MSQILEIDSFKRATVNDLFKDEWFKNIPYCKVDTIDGRYIRAAGHRHILPNHPTTTTAIEDSDAEKASGL